jgi:beta-mannanase
VDLIPSSLADVNDPLGWEQSCDAGNFNGYATTLGTNLVAAGLQNSVIRLGAEMNGAWEQDYIGTTTQEQNDWATCFDNEVTAMRQATGEHFLFDWNPNACTQQIPYANFYPGNAYVDIVGLDMYDAACSGPTTGITFSQFANQSYGLAPFEAFAAAQGKPMSFPEWGLDSSTAGDDATYVNGIGSTVANGDFAFQEYFDDVDGWSMMLDNSASPTPAADAAYAKWFGNS